MQIIEFAVTKLMKAECRVLYWKESGAAIYDGYDRICMYDGMINVFFFQFQFL